MLDKLINIIKMVFTEVILIVSLLTRIMSLQVSRVMVFTYPLIISLPGQLVI